MARVELIFPEPAVFTERVVLRTTDMSRAGHLGFDTQVRLIHHVMTRFFDHCGMAASGGGGISNIVKDLAVIYQGEAHAGDHLSIAVGVGERGDRWVELYFRLLRDRGPDVAGPPLSGQPVALAKLAVLSFDYDKGVSVAFPAGVRKAMQNAEN